MAELADELKPPNENGSRGTGTPTLMPTMPASSRSAAVRATAPEVVKMAAPFAVQALVLEVDRLVERLGVHDAQHRPEDLLAARGHVDGDVVQHGGADPVALGARRRFWPRPSTSTLAPAFSAALDVLEDPLARRGRDDRAHVFAQADLPHVRRRCRR